MKSTFQTPMSYGTEHFGNLEVEYEIQGGTCNLLKVSYIATGSTATAWIPVGAIIGMNYYDTLVEMAHNDAAQGNSIDHTTDIQNEHYAQLQGRLS